MENNHLPSVYLKHFAVFIGIGISMLFSCNKFEYNPFVTENSDSPTKLNAKNIAKLLSTESISDDTVTILFTGDSQRFYNRLDDLVAKANEFSNIDFLLLGGDITDFGLLQEFLWIHERLENLRIPYVCVIGNHDLTSSGSQIYTQMFGPKNFTFTYKNYKFLCYDNNSHEYNFPGNVPDLNWLSNELTNSSASWFVGAAHVPPWNPDFDQTLVHDYLNLFGSTPGFILSLHGHLVDPNAEYINNDFVLYINSSGVQKDKCYLLKLIHGTVIKQLIEY